MSRETFNRFGLGAEITWRPQRPPKQPENVRVVLHELTRWQQQGHHFTNYRELAEACGLSEVDTKRACAWLDGAKLIDERREPTR